MEINSDNNRRVLTNIRRIYKNYNLLKSLARSSVSMKVPNDRYWSFMLGNPSPSLSDICKHLIYTKFFYVYERENYYTKRELFPLRMHIAEYQVYSMIIRHELNRTSDIQFDYLFEKYQAERLFQGTDSFKHYFEEFYEYYCKPGVLVELLDKDSIIEALGRYGKL